MSLYPVPLPAFRDNYIWCLSRDGRALVVDPGDATVVEGWLERNGLELECVLVTHHHPDHVGGLEALKRHHHPRVFGPDEGITGIDVVLAGGEELDLGRFGRATVMAVPGHTLGHIAYYLPEHELLFCGDTLFSAGCGRLFEGTARQLHDSLHSLAALPDSTLVCCTHEYTQANLRFAAAVEPGNPDRAEREEEVQALRSQGRPSLPVVLGKERLYNPFLRCTVPSVTAAASAFAGQSLQPGVQVFAALRGWKDVF
ncbi:MAG: gloB2 [Moraxellaceae bacterium]|nr:gloB2 [Moraxellaceae bacterium]